MAAQLAAMAELFDSARTHPHTYLTEGGLLARDAIELAAKTSELTATAFGQKARRLADLLVRWLTGAGIPTVRQTTVRQSTG
jgi:hypothetical protein